MNGESVNFILIGSLTLNLHSVVAVDLSSTQKNQVCSEISEIISEKPEFLAGIKPKRHGSKVALPCASIA